MFRLGVLGMVVVLGIFGYRTIIDPIKPAAADLTTTTTTSSTTTTTVAGETTTTVEGETTTTVEGETTTTLAAAPFVVVSPRDETHVAGASILLAGTGTPGGVVARAEIATNVDARGVWSLRLPLVPGANELALTETLPDGSTQTASLTVHYDA